MPSRSQTRFSAGTCFVLPLNCGLSGPLADALNTETIVAAIGPVCADALQALGVTPDVIPARTRMGSMISALAEYFELDGRRMRRMVICNGGNGVMAR